MKRFPGAVLALLTLALASCGGGSGDPAAAPSPAPAPAPSPTPVPSPAPAPSLAYPFVAPSVGDWASYRTVSSFTLPDSAPQERFTRTALLTSIDSGGAQVYAETTSAGTPARSRTLDSSGALVSLGTPRVVCTYSPAYLDSPPRTAAVGSIYASNSSYSCLLEGSTVTASGTIGVQSGSQAAEDKTTALGSFKTFRYTQTISQQDSAFSYAMVETCWVDVVTGLKVSCTLESTTTPKTDTQPTVRETRVTDLVAYSLRGAAPVGETAVRYEGTWKLSLASPTGAGCPVVTVSMGRAVSGYCTIPASAGADAITGLVASDGTVSFTTASGVSFTGRFTSQLQGNGTWSAGADGGTWTAARS